MSNDPYGTVATGKNVQFVRDIGRAPAAHIPGQPVAHSPAGHKVPAKAYEPAQTLVEFLPLVPAAVAPALGTTSAAGYDLAVPAAVTLQPGQRTAIPLGFALALPAHLHGRIESRSGLALKGMVVLTGVIDADYRGELKVIMQNFSSEPHTFAAGDRVAQLVLRRTEHVAFETVQLLDSTERGGGGFGSTGV